jgi:hypothetical protein
MMSKKASSLPNEEKGIIRTVTPPTQITREETEKGDIAKSLQQLVYTQFVSKRFKDIIGSTRFTKEEAMTYGLLEINRVISLILSIDVRDVEPKVLSGLSVEEQIDLRDKYELKLRFQKNPFAFSFAVHDAFMSMYGLALQSLEGGSRTEGSTMVGGTYQKILQPEDLGAFEKIKRRIMGNVLYVDKEGQ